MQQVPSEGHVRRRPPAVATAPSHAAATRSATMAMDIDTHVHIRVHMHHQHIGIREHAAQHMAAAAGAWLR